MGAAALATLLHVGFSSSKPVGYDATKTVWTYYSYFYPRGRPIKDSVCVAQAGDMLAAPLSLFGELERSAAGVLYSSLLRHRRDPLPRRWGRELLPGGRLPSCFFVDDLFFSAYAAYSRATVYAHPWRRWLFREAKRRKRTGEPRSRPARREAARRKRCSCGTHGLAHGAVRERHSTNCQSELEALGWWTRGTEGDPCVLGDF